MIGADVSSGSLCPPVGLMKHLRSRARQEELCQAIHACARARVGVWCES
jgi:hypothetical protein